MRGLCEVTSNEEDKHHELRELGIVIVENEFLDILEPFKSVVKKLDSVDDFEVLLGGVGLLSDTVLEDVSVLVEGHV